MSSETVVMQNQPALVSTDTLLPEEAALIALVASLAVEQVIGEHLPKNNPSQPGATA